MSSTRRIAMWSGPRNISTAMMRAWENRADTAVIDEPFYAFYLWKTGKPHPGAKQIIAQGETDWRKIVAHLTGPVPDSARIFYQKQMTHHLLPEVSRDWLAQVTNCFLIREPAAVINSYLKKNNDPAPQDLGFPQQLEIFSTVRKLTGKTPPVLEADDVLRDPARTLRLLCQALEVEFCESMLAWPSGPRPSDGIWAKHWYGEVERSTSFAPYRENKVEMPKHLRDVEARCRECYEELFRHRLK